MRTITAYCFASGHIQFGKKVPHGAIIIAFGPKKEVIQAVAGSARTGYPSEPGAKDSVLLVPGIPEADNEEAKRGALQNYCTQVDLRLALVPAWIKEQTPVRKLNILKAARERLTSQTLQNNPVALERFMRIVEAISI